MRAEPDFPAPRDSSAPRGIVLQPCDTSCAYAEFTHTGELRDDWIWCHHPAAPHQLIRAGRDCPRYQPNWPVGS